MNALRFALNLSQRTSDDTVRKYANVSNIKDTVKELAKSWYKNSVVKNPDIQGFDRTAQAYSDMSLAYINKSL